MELRFVKKTNNGNKIRSFNISNIEIKYVDKDFRFNKPMSLNTFIIDGRVRIIFNCHFNDGKSIIEKTFIATFGKQDEVNNTEVEKFFNHLSSADLVVLNKNDRDREYTIESITSSWDDSLRTRIKICARKIYTSWVGDDLYKEYFEMTQVKFYDKLYHLCLRKENADRHLKTEYSDECDGIVIPFSLKQNLIAPSNSPEMPDIRTIDLSKCTPNPNERQDSLINQLNEQMLIDKLFREGGIKVIQEDMSDVIYLFLSRRDYNQIKSKNFYYQNVTLNFGEPLNFNGFFRWYDTEVQSYINSYMSMMIHGDEIRSKDCTLFSYYLCAFINDNKDDLIKLINREQSGFDRVDIKSMINKFNSTYEMGVTLFNGDDSAYRARLIDLILNYKEDLKITNELFNDIKEKISKI